EKPPAGDGYIERLKATDRGTRLRIQVLHWDKYQSHSGTTNETTVPSSPATGLLPLVSSPKFGLDQSQFRTTPDSPQTPLPEEEPKNGIQEQQEAPAHEGLQTWRRWYDQTFAGRFPPTLKAEVLDNMTRDGMDHAVVIAALKAAVAEDKRDPLSWAAAVAANMFAAGVRTTEQAEDYRRRQEEANQHGRPGGGPGPPGAKTPGPGAVETGGGRAGGGRADGGNLPRAPDSVAAKYVGLGQPRAPADDGG
ncbi:MAG: DnaD domain protein, partial [Dehalococcoidia bacterium]|nr:DnaD domain protein [Dehalococcoidia bacterium]